MAIFNLPGGLKIERTLVYRGPAPAEGEGEPLPRPEPSPSPEPTFLEKAVEAVEEAVKPKSRRGRPKKKAEQSELNLPPANRLKWLRLISKLSQPFQPKSGQTVANG